MKNTIIKLAAHIEDMARFIGTESDALGADVGISGAECIIALRDAQHRLRSAQDALRLAIAQANDECKKEQQI